MARPAFLMAAAAILGCALSSASCSVDEREARMEGADSTRLAPGSPQAQDEAGSKAAFLAAYPVFMHARCMNCHPAGDTPLIGDASQLHPQNVKRGSDGRGRYAMRCGNCHQLEHLRGENMPPGHPNWHLPPADMPMVFEGRTAAQLARQFKDPKQNGGKTLAEILKHVEEDSLVLVCWKKSDGRSLPPLDHKEFARHFREWVEKGAAIPE